MAYVITDDCVACGTCIGECPVGAISEGDNHVRYLRRSVPVGGNSSRISRVERSGNYTYLVNNKGNNANCCPYLSYLYYLTCVI